MSPLYKADALLNLHGLLYKALALLPRSIWPAPDRKAVFTYYRQKSSETYRPDRC